MTSAQDNREKAKEIRLAKLMDRVESHAEDHYKHPTAKTRLHAVLCDIMTRVGLRMSELEKEERECAMKKRSIS